MALACQIAQGTAPSNVGFEEWRFRKGLRTKHESVVEATRAAVPRAKLLRGA